MLPGALEIKELPGARLETCGAYKEHDFQNAREEIERLTQEEIVPLEKPPILS
jgi:S-ribosylhomocysteine lyase LuxS involved in autoinducer biosynthesis